MPSTENTEPQQNKYAPSAWGGEVFEDVTMPSGQLAQLRRPGVQGLMAAGLLESLDSLTGIVQSDLITMAEKGKVPDIDARAIVADPKKLETMMHLIDRVTVHCVLQPEIKMSPNDITSRQQGVIYTDMIDLDDRMFIFNYAMGGTRDLERFRTESAAALGNLGHLKKASRKAK